MFSVATCEKLLIFNGKFSFFGPSGSLSNPPLKALTIGQAEGPGRQGTITRPSQGNTIWPIGGLWWPMGLAVSYWNSSRHPPKRVEKASKWKRPKVVSRNWNKAAIVMALHAYLPLPA